MDLLGEFQLRQGEADARPRSRKARGLLGYLGVAPDQSVSRERAADLLWSDRGNDQARGSLRQTLAELRAGNDALGEVIRISRETVALERDRVEVDIDVILDAAERGDAALLARRLEGAGPFLADLSGLSPAFDEWLLIERVRQIDRVEAGVLARLPGMIGNAPAMDIQSILRSLDRLDPWNEAVARLGLEADHVAGDVASLHKRFRRLAEGLQREFGVRPSDETQALFDRLTAAPDPETTPASTQKAPETQPPMILVSPIAVIGDERDTAELAAIVSDDIRTALNQHEDIRVLTLEATDLDRIERVCRDSLSAYMLSGRIRRIGADVRINLQIGSVASSSIVWSEQLRVDIEDIGNAVDEVVERAVGSVLPAIDHDLSTRVPLSDFHRSDVVTQYAKARRLIGRGQDHAGTQAGVDLLERIVAENPRHIGARMLLARMYNNDFWQGVAGHDVAAFRARAFALTEEAAALAPGNSRIQLRLAWCHLRQREWQRAERGLNSAAARLTYDADGLNECASGFALLGELDRAEPLIQRAFRLNPFAPADYHADRAIALMLRDETVAAEEHFDVSGEQSPLYLYARLMNLIRLPGTERTRERLRQDFTAAFARAWRRDEPARLDDVVEWIGHIFPLRLPEHADRLRDGINTALGSDWQVAPHNSR